MRNSFDFDDITDWLADNKLILGILALGGFAAFSMFAGGGYQQLQAKLDKESRLTSTVEQQSQAEEIFRTQGCSAQVLDAETLTANLKEGSFVIDPLSLTRANEPTAIASGFVCSLDGSVYRVTNGRAELIGTSPRIRDELVRRGIPREVRAMEDYAKKLYGGKR